MALSTTSPIHSMPRTVRTIVVATVVALVWSVVVPAQEATTIIDARGQLTVPPPALTQEQRIMVELNNEIERLANDLQAALIQVHDALEQAHDLQVQVSNLTRAYNTLRLSLVRERSTPKVAGWVFDWQIDPETGRRRGLIPKPPDAEDPE